MGNRDKILAQISEMEYKLALIEYDIDKVLKSCRQASDDLRVIRQKILGTDTTEGKDVEK